MPRWHAYMKLTGNGGGLLGSEFAFLRSQVVAVTLPASVRRFRVPRATVPANLIMQPDFLRELFLHDISDRR